VDAAPDELTKPLGLDKPAGKGSRLSRMKVIGGAVATFVACGAVAVLFLGSPRPGPFAVAPIQVRPVEEKPTQAAAETEAADPTRRTAAEVETASGVSVVRPDGESPPAAVVIRVPENGPIKLQPAPDPRLVERTRYGMLPRIGADGARPAQVYARPSGSLPGGAKPVGRVALLVGGLGISQSATAEAIAKLPPAVTLALAPYGTDLERTVAQAREAGHEVMLQVPMEPFDYPDNDPGPHTLLLGAKPQDNMERLHWVMGRFPGYTGLVNFMGAKLTSDDAAMAPILNEVASRGLVFLDDGSSSRSVIGRADRPAPTARASLVVDTVPRPDAIDRELRRLEELAREGGLAIGTASALPVTIDRISRWAKSLEGKGILLVPVSAAYEPGKGRS